MPDNNFKKIITHQYVLCAFIGIETLLYIIFLMLDFMKEPSAHIKYLSICLCLAVSLYILKVKHSYMCFVAMALTLIADTFLLLLDDYYIVGVSAFCVVQTIYAKRLMSHSGMKSVIPRIALFLTAIVVLRLLDSLDYLTALSAWSFTQLMANVIHGFLIKKQFAGGNIFAAGLLLFWACDACVGLNNLINYIPEFTYAGIIAIASFCMWLFYLPSQVLIVLSFFKE